MIQITHYSADNKMRAQKQTSKSEKSSQV